MFCMSTLEETICAIRVSASLNMKAELFLHDQSTSRKDIPSQFLKYLMTHWDGTSLFTRCYSDIFIVEQLRLEGTSDWII